MLTTDTRLSASHAELAALLRQAPDLREDEALTAVLALLRERRAMDLSDLPPGEQAALVAARARELLPSRERLAELLTRAADEGRGLTVKFGIDPTTADVHVGHTVPMIVAGRLQRMGHRVVFIVGDITARIGDPSGRSGDRPPLTDADVAANLRTYRAQVTPFFDFERADFRLNSEWLAPVTLPRFLDVLAGLPVSAALQREDFRTRIADGGGLTMAELVYSVVMALDSVELAADVELGGVDQLLNMQMCRRLMANAGQPPEAVVATPLIEGTDANGTKMSKSRGNHIGLACGETEMFGKLMASPDRLMPEYLRALTELLDPEIELLLRLAGEGRVHPMGVKALLASDVTGAVYGLEKAARAREGFRARFSRRRYSEAADVPVVTGAEHGDSSVGRLFAEVTGLVGSVGQVRRTAAGGGLRLVAESGGGQEAVVLGEADVNGSLAGVLAAHAELGSGAAGAVRRFLKCGRAVVEVR